MNYRIGLGTDTHRLVAGRKLLLGGVDIESDLGADGHSDADVVMHAVADAILGSLALGDLGTHFPDHDERWRDAASGQFVSYAVDLVGEKGYSIQNLDVAIDLEKPRLRPHIGAMRENVASALRIEVDRVSIKAKTGEGVDAVGECRAVRAQAVVLVSLR